MRLDRSLLMLLRAIIGAQIVLGVGFWTGHWHGLVDLHRGLGVIFVLVLWSIAGIALAGRRSTGLAVFTIVWGLIIAGLGFSQQQILVGDLHWIVRVVHLAVALAAIPMGERLAASTERR
ncbi:MAG TPA: hypothetical protein VHV78_01965 [Gemmatimonadaceae bacterium]|nr:hypothetical protein [Gemmatimonadaceae bacterium]